MCLALPSRVLAVDGLMARIDSEGVEREVSLMLMDVAVAVGDYVLVQHGAYAYERVDAARAEEALQLMQALMQGEAADIRAW
jgi:hydrogenase expression/formation protein HypC